MTANKAQTYCKNATSSAGRATTDVCVDTPTGPVNALGLPTARCMVRIWAVDEVERTKCGQETCQQSAMARVSWPGKAPQLLCITCSGKALHIAEAMGFHLHAESIKNG